MHYLEQQELEKLSAHNLPIKNGDGRTAETAYILKGIRKFDAPSVESLVIDLSLKASGFLFWQLNKQTFTIIKSRKLDLLKITATKNGESKEFTFYFDLTDLE